MRIWPTEVAPIFRISSVAAPMVSVTPITVTADPAWTPAPMLMTRYSCLPAVLGLIVGLLLGRCAPFYNYPCWAYRRTGTPGGRIPIRTAAGSALHVA